MCLKSDPNVKIYLARVARGIEPENRKVFKDNAVVPVDEENKTPISNTDNAMVPADEESKAP